MNTPGTRISTKADFPHVEVYMRPGDGGPVMTLCFPNPEYSFSRYFFAVMLALPGWPLILLIALPVLIPAARQAGIHWAVPTITLLAIIAILVMWLMAPARKRRSIVLDTGRDRLIAWNANGTVERQLSTLKNLTTEPHPRGEWERHKKHGELGPFQKQHCLFGWFGARGAEKVELMTRYEWPVQNSLYEVLQAVAWAIERSGAGRAEGPKATPESGARREAGHSIRPPLD
jgi:hypothetical protein